MFMLNVNARKSEILPIITIIIGAFFVFVPYNIIKDVLFIFMGIVIIFLNLLPCVINFKLASQNSKYYVNAIFSLLGVILGFLLIFNHGLATSIVIAVYLIIMPLIRISSSDNKTKQLKSELPLFILAAVLLFTPLEAIFKIVLIIFGIILIVIGGVNLILTIAYNSKKKNNFDDFNGFNDDNDKTISNKDSIIDAEVKEL